MGSYETRKNGKPVTVQFTDGGLIRDVADLWAIVEGEYEGTPSMESEQLKSLLGELQAGKPLSDTEFSIYNRLLRKYSSELKAFRASPDNASQGYVPAPLPGSGRIMEGLALMAPSFRERLREASPFAPAVQAPTGAMVALYPDPATAEKLAVANGNSADSLHLTLAFLGPAAMIRDVSRVRNVVGRWATHTPPLTGMIAGTGQFITGDATTYASADIPALPAAREDLVGRLQSAGCPPSSLHGFTPHVSLAPDLRDVKVDPLPLAFDHVALVIAGDRTNFPLTGLDAPMRLSALNLGLAPLR